MRQGKRPRIRRIGVYGATALVALALIGAGVVNLAQAEHPAATQLDMRGRAVQLDPGTTPPPAVQAQMKVTEATGERFAVPSVGLDVPLGALNEIGNAITPPGFRSAYIVRNMGTTLDTPGDGTVYVVMHALRGGGLAPGNYLTDLRAQTSALSSGAAITVGPQTYDVVSSDTVSKAALPSDATVWTNIPNRLVVITCMEHANGSPSTDNLVIFATRQP